MKSLGWLAVIATSRAVAAADGPLEYNRDIRPILIETCFACHGPDSASRKGDYRLDRRDDAIGKKVIVPGHPDESEALRRILSTDPDEVMPPPSTRKVLTAEQKKILEEKSRSSRNRGEDRRCVAET